MDTLDQGEISDECPTLKFQDGSYSLPELLESHLLPVVAQLDTTRQPVPLNEFNFDLSQPLLLYKKRNIQKVAARSLYIKDEKYEDIGESLLIPEDYKGWFAVLQRVTGNTRADDTVPHFTSVEELAQSNTERFLVGGTKKISALQINDRTGAQLKHEQRNFLPGDILSIEKIYYGETRKRTRLFRKPKYITEKFLMCRDESDREVLLPFEQTGIFYQISHKCGKAMKNVLQMSDIVARKLTPRIIKLVYGRFPITPCSFTGLMRAESSKIEMSIIASTIIHTKNILLEFPVTSAMHFRVATMDDSLRQNPCYRGAMSMCAERAITYMRNIKVCYNFTTDDDSGIANSHPLLVHQNSMPIKTNSQNSIDSETTPPQTRRHNVIMKTFSDNEDYMSHRHTCLPEDKTDIIIRPARCTSTGRMSFCLGNSYLTVPVFEPGSNTKRNSGNNNTLQEAVYTTRRGSKISFNGKFFEEESIEAEDNTGLPNSSLCSIPPALAHTNIGSYINIVSPPKIQVNGDFEDYISTSGSRRPSTQAPTVSPPPVPESASTSGVSSGSTSSVSDGTISNRGSTESFEYAVPKIDESQRILSDIRERSKSSSETSNVDNCNKPRARRPSTVTFSEGCFLSSTTASKPPACGVIPDELETKSEEGSPIYENIKSLLELVTELEIHKEESEDDHEKIDEIVEAEHTSYESESFTDTTIISDKITELNDVNNTNENLSDDDEIEANDTTTDQNDTNVETTEHFFISERERKDDFSKDTQATKVYSNKDISDTSEAVEEKDIPSVKESICCDSENAIVSNESLTNNQIENDQEPNTEQTVIEIKEHKEIFVKENGRSLSLEDLPDNLVIKRNRSATCSAIEAIKSDIEECAHVQTTDNLVVGRNRSATCSALETGTSEIDESSNVRPSDSCNLWRLAVKNMLNDSGEINTRIANYNPRYNTGPSEKPLELYTSEDIAKQLRGIGIKEVSVQQLEVLQVDGSSFQKILDGELSIRDCLNGVNLIDQQKISMFIRGWRPSAE